MTSLSMSTSSFIPHSCPTLGCEEWQRVAHVLVSGQVVRGPCCKAFEAKVAKRVGCKYGLAVSSGLAALHVTLASLGIKQWDEVILPALVCEAPLLAVKYCGATPIVVDVDPSTGNITPDAVNDALTNNTRLVIVPHMFGTPAEVAEIVYLGCTVLEDCAQTIGAKHQAQNVGTFGVASIFSFYATKVLCTGEGGMVLTDDLSLAEEVSDLRDYRKHSDFRVRFGYSMTDVSAAMGLVQLGKLDGFISRRREIAALYAELLQGVKGVTCPDQEAHKESIFYRYIVKVPPESRDRIRKDMKQKGVECGLGVLHTLDSFVPSQPCTVAREYAQSSLSLPIYPSLSDEDARRVVKVLEEVI